MRLFIQFINLLLIFLLASCVSQESYVNPVELTLPAKRLQQYGYSFVPPNEQGWLVSQPSRMLITLQKHGSYANEILIIHGSPSLLRESQLDKDFISLITETQKEEWSEPRYTLSKHEVVPYNEKQNKCIKSTIVMEDSGALTESGSRIVMMREVYTLNCIHPGKPEIVINVTYSHRYPPGKREEGIINRATDFFNSVKFSSF